MRNFFSVWESKVAANSAPVSWLFWFIQTFSFKILFFPLFMFSNFLFCALLKIWKQNLPFECTISDGFFTRCLPIAFTPTSAFLFTSECEIIFSPNCRKFAVEWDWNRKNFQSVQNLVFFCKKDGFFRKKILKLFKIATCGNFFLECVWNGSILKKRKHQNSCFSAWF